MHQNVQWIVDSHYVCRTKKFVYHIGGIVQQKELFLYHYLNFPAYIHRLGELVPQVDLFAVISNWGCEAQAYNHYCASQLFLNMAGLQKEVVCANCSYPLAIGRSKKRKL